MFEIDRKWSSITFILQELMWALYKVLYKCMTSYFLKGRSSDIIKMRDDTNVTNKKHLLLFYSITL